MSDILIRGMAMPRNCDDCPFENHSGSFQCLANKRLFEVYPADRKMKWCPLTELPPHGRLIDADALAEYLKRQCEEVFKIDAVSPDDFWITRNQAYNERLWKTWCESFFEYLKTRETIIPASKEEM